MNRLKNSFVLEEINHKDECGGGLLHEAIAGENFDSALFLIDNGFNVNMTDEDSNMPLHLIAEYPNLEVAKPILYNRGITRKNTFINEVNPKKLDTYFKQFVRHEFCIIQVLCFFILLCFMYRVC